MQLFIHSRTLFDSNYYKDPKVCDHCIIMDPQVNGAEFSCTYSETCRDATVETQNPTCSTSGTIGI